MISTLKTTDSDLRLQTLDACASRVWEDFCFLLFNPGATIQLEPKFIFEYGLQRKLRNECGDLDYWSVA